MMNPKTTFTINSIFSLILSISMFFLYEFILSTFGLSDDPSNAAIHLARTVGFIMFGMSIIMWSLRDNPIRLAIVGFALIFTFDTISIILEINNGIVNSLGWIMAIGMGTIAALNAWTAWSLYKS